jgi:hypothetical protein
VLSSPPGLAAEKLNAANFGFLGYISVEGFMTARQRFGKSGLDDRSGAEKAREWNASLISRQLVRMECLRGAHESEKHCHRRMAVAMGLFLGLLLVLSAAALWLLWMKISGTFSF